MDHKHWRMIIAMLMFFIRLELPAQLPVPLFDNRTTEQTESGYLKLSWKPGASSADRTPYLFELQQAIRHDFTQTDLIYKGKDYATFLSGLPDGQFYYRVRAVSPDGAQYSDWSAPVLVQVAHHSLRLAFLLFGIGAVVFLITVGIVVQGVRSSAQNH